MGPRRQISIGNIHFSFKILSIIYLCIYYLSICVCVCVYVYVCMRERERAHVVGGRKREFQADSTHNVEVHLGLDLMTLTS